VHITSLYGARIQEIKESHHKFATKEVEIIQLNQSTLHLYSNENSTSYPKKAKNRNLKKEI
jgi:hypothetical protein